MNKIEEKKEDEKLIRNEKGGLKKGKPIATITIDLDEQYKKERRKMKKKRRKKEGMKKKTCPQQQPALVCKRSQHQAP